MTKFINENLQIENELQGAAINAVFDVSNFVTERKNLVHHNHEHQLDTMKSINFAGLQEIFDESLNNQTKASCIYMTLFEAILLVIGATRD